MAKKDLQSALKRFHCLRALNKITRVAAAVRRVAALMSVLLLTVNLIGVIKTMGFSR